MTFKADKSSSRYRLIDSDRNLEMSQGPGAHGNHTSYFHEIGSPELYLGGGFKWTVSTRVLDGEEREKSPDGKHQIETYWVSGPWIQKGEFPIQGYTEVETLQIIREALLEKQNFFTSDSMRYTRTNIVFWSRAKSLLRAHSPDR